jgi:multisubunit Na+/H+ antiporter MnhB subunit
MLGKLLLIIVLTVITAIIVFFGALAFIFAHDSPEGAKKAGLISATLVVGPQILWLCAVIYIIRY